MSEITSPLLLAVSSMAKHYRALTLPGHGVLSIPAGKNREFWRAGLGLGWPRAPSPEKLPGMLRGRKEGALCPWRRCSIPLEGQGDSSSLSPPLSRFSHCHRLSVEGKL